MPLAKEKQLKKLVLILAISILVIGINKKDIILDGLSYIDYIFCFQKK